MNDGVQGILSAHTPVDTRLLLNGIVWTLVFAWSALTRLVPDYTPR